MENAVSIVSQVGFPIAVAIGLFWYIVTEQKELRKTVENNTNVMLKILEHIKGGEN